MLKRYWINQPFKNQKFHDLHGKKVLADIEGTNNGICECYFTDGDIVSQKIEYMALSPDWPETSDHRILEDDEKIVVSIAKMDEILRNWINEADLDEIAMVAEKVFGCDCFTDGSKFEVYPNKNYADAFADVFNYELYVGNIGRIGGYPNIASADKDFDEYVRQSKIDYGRASNEEVYLIECDTGETVKHYQIKNNMEDELSTSMKPD